jgi:hypothetical protein
MCAAATGPDGKVYFFGGDPYPSPGVLATVTVFDPKTNLWSAAPPMPSARYALGAATGKDGLIYIVGGANGGTSPENVAFDTATLTWVVKTNLPNALWAVTAVAGNDGNLYVLGAPSTGPIEFTVYGTTSASWTAGPTSQLALFDVLSMGTDGRIYATGGGGPVGPGASLTIFDPETGSWVSGPNFNFARAHHVSAPLADGRILIAFGISGMTLVPQAEAFDPNTNTWSSVAAPPNPIGQGCGATGQDGRVYVAGGVEAAGVPNTALYVYLPETDRWVSSN